MKTTETVYLKKIWFLVRDTNPVYSNTIGCARDVYRHYNSKITWFIFSHRAICVRDFFCRVLTLTIASNVWLIDWILFYAASAIFQPYDDGDSWLKVISFEILKCPWRPPRIYSSTKSSETVFCVPRGLLSLTWGPIWRPIRRT